MCEEIKELMDKGVSETDAIVIATKIRFNERFSENLREVAEYKVEKRGDKWCTVHCSGPDKGKVIKCFDSQAEAQEQHRAIQANK
jgi:uncharacterized protein YoaH (UPF0181 family)